MSFTATFYELSKRVNSTKRAGVGTPVLSTNIILKEGCSAQAPVVGVKWDGSSNPSRYNMAHISTFGRYYWVTDWTYQDRIWWATLKTDVLATAKTEIGNSTKYVLRAASDYDPNVPDHKYFPIMPCSVQNTTVTGLGTWATDFSGGRFVVGIIGSGNNFTGAGIGYYVLTGSGLQGLYNACFTLTENLWGNQSQATTVGEALQEFGGNIQKSVLNPAQYVNSICWVPFVPSSTGSTEEIMLGNLASGTFGHPLLDPIHTDTFSVVVPYNDHGDDPWMYMAPYVQYRLHIPPFPDVALDGARIYGHNISGRIKTDVTNGLALLEVGTAGAAEYLTVSGNVGIPLSFAGNSIDYFNAIKSAATGVASAVGAGMAGNAAGAISGTVSAVGGVIEALAPIATPGTYGGGIGAIAAAKHLTRTLYTVPDRDNTEQGRPLCKLKQLSTLSGYILCADGEVAAPLTEGELRQIEQFLTGGFFYE